jgi:hypothetical protein
MSPGRVYLGVFGLIVMITVILACISIIFLFISCGLSISNDALNLFCDDYFCEGEEHKFLSSICRLSVKIEKTLDWLIKLSGFLTCLLITLIFAEVSVSIIIFIILKLLKSSV